MHLQTVVDSVLLACQQSLVVSVAHSPFESHGLFSISHSHSFLRSFSRFLVLSCESGHSSCLSPISQSRAAPPSSSHPPALCVFVGGFLRSDFLPEF